MDRAAEANGDLADSLEMRVVLALFAPLPAGAFIVVDDRYLNAFPRRDDGTPVVSTWDIFFHLHATGHMNDDRFFALVTEMRRRGLMYIPVKGEEIVYYVSRARIEDGMMTTSEEMRVLERYIAAVLLSADALHASTGAPEGPGMSQALYVFQLSAAVRNAIRALLADGSPEAEGRASWVREHLAVDGLPGFGMAGFFGSGSSAQGAIDIDVANFLTDYLIS